MKYGGITIGEDALGPSTFAWNYLQQMSHLLLHDKASKISLVLFKLQLGVVTLDQICPILCHTNYVRTQNTKNKLYKSTSTNILDFSFYLFYFIFGGNIEFYVER